LGLLSTVDELTGVHALGGNEQLLPDLVSVRVTKVDDSKGSTTTRVVDNVPHNSLDIAIAFGIVDGPELGGTLPTLGSRRENGSGTLTLGTNNTTHD
jgi:hypothetical protein